MHTKLDITVKERLSVRPRRLFGWRVQPAIRRIDADGNWITTRAAVKTPIYTLGEPYEVRGVQVFAHEAVYDKTESVRMSRKVPKRLRRILHRPGIRPDNREVVTSVVKTLLEANVR